ncbi:MAG TPA: PfkB family carbohydrate kinase [Pseudonocardia sp.]|jgi:sugar/nucleoside kinase (ribokinase family)|uniref:PfkB family carbohydrate kinase n=1 Tax=Pseudonocardia sp. TaxID=60912 RepID=UPI002B4B2453|nr:PfkB family carbohydrate kinase [Pseudonocardia sp.]HLU56383.1 PfkB family carbohydrate kinase [Pseudonocardia sp.]
MTGRLVHTGQVVLDLVMRVKELPPVGGDVFASHTDLHPGGGFNVMAAAARAGGQVVYAGGHGDGRFGDLVRAALDAEGITAALPPTPGADTGICVVLVDDTGERTFVTGTGAESEVDAAALAAVPVDAADVVYVSGYSLLAPDKAAVLLDRIDRLDGPTVLVDPGPLVGEVDPATWARLLDRTTILSANAREARILTGEADPRAASAELARRLPSTAAVIVRDGAAGCLVTRDGTTVHVPGFPVDAVDTTGAGDAHCGVLAAELLRGADLVAAATRANAAAAIAVTRPGPATAPTRAEVDQLLSSDISRPRPPLR